MDKKLYSENWEELSEQVKKEAGYKCEFCGHVHDPSTNYTLTTHHLIPDRTLNERWNLAAACQRCQLRAEGQNKTLRKLLVTWYRYAHKDWLMEQLKQYTTTLRKDLMKIK